jgi:phytoene desaturase (3,4-didehydrolycopene-forming)
VRSPNFYVAAPSRTDPTAAPADGDSIMVLLPVANIQQRRGDDDYAQLVAAGRQLVLRSMQAAGVGIQQQDIVQETVREPAQWRQLHGLEHGAAFGMSHGLTQLALLRPGAVDPGAPRGLFFVGASSRPGNGVPLVMLGAQQTAKRILRARA